MTVNESIQAERRGRVSRYAPLIIWIALILFLSTMSGSMTNTSRFIRPILMWLFPGTPDEIIAIYHGYVRKAGHFVGYAILAFWAWRAFWESSKLILRRYWFLFAFLLVLMVAALDEFNQSFNAQRTGSINDVLLDAFGGLCLILLMAAIRRQTVRS